MTWLTDRHKTIACVLIISLLAILFMGESLSPDRTLRPLDIVMAMRPWSATDFRVTQVHNSLPSDTVLYISPIKVLTARAWREGIPLWEPGILSGYPIIGNAQAGIFYPGTLPYLFLSDANAADLVMLFHLIVAGVGLFGYLRAIRCHHLAALLGALVFMLNTSFLAWLAWDSVAGAWVWLPWALWAFEVALRPHRLGTAALGALAVALIYLGGHLQWSLYAMLILMLYSAFRLAAPGASGRRRVLVVALLLGVGGTALAAIQLLPALDYINAGTRGVIPFEAIASTRDWSGFLMLWVPRFFGSGFLPPQWRGPINYNESVMYVSLLPLLLTLMALVWRRDGLTLFFAAVGLLGALCAAGTDVYRLLHWLPGFNGFLPDRLRYLVTVSLSMLSALGLDMLLRQRGRLRVRLIVSVTTLAVLLGGTYAAARGVYLPTDPARLNQLQGQEQVFVALLLISVLLLIAGIGLKRWGQAALMVACALAIVDLWQVGAAYYQPMPTQYDYPATRSIQLMLNDEDRFRVLTVRSDWSTWALRPDLPAVLGLNDIGGYDSTYLRRYVNYLQRIDQTGPATPASNFLAPSHFDSPLVDLLNVKYAITSDKPKVANWELIDKSEMRLYRNNAPLPRAWIANQAEIVPSDEAIFERLIDPQFDPRQTVIIERPTPQPSGSHSAESAGTVQIDRYTNNRLSLTVDLQRAGWLVLSEIYYPGWHATIDGAPADIYRADYTFRSVPVPPGHHRVELWFLPDSFVSGATVSAASLSILILWSIIAWRRIQ